MSTEELLLDALDKRLLGESLARVYQRDASVPAVFLLCTHEWGNIGDLAINVNEIAMLESALPGHAVFPISRSALAANWQRIRASINSRDYIAIHGGGNMGDIWPHEEAARLAVVEAFPGNRIISLAQSIHFDDPLLLRKSMGVYKRHPGLLLAVRDDESEAIAREHLAAEAVVRTEDVVCRQPYPFAFRSRGSHILFVQRDDQEKRDNNIDHLRERAVAAGLEVERTDTTVPRLPFVGTELAAKLVYNKIDELHAARVVVTDRLHGALFALIAGRPVVVFENSYGKIGRALRNLLPSLGHRIRFAGAEGLTPVILDEIARLPETNLRPEGILVDQHRRFDEAISAHLSL